MWTLWVVFRSDLLAMIAYGFTWVFFFGMACFLDKLIQGIYSCLCTEEWCWWSGAALSDYCLVFLTCLAFEDYVLACLEFFVAWAGGGSLYVVCVVIFPKVPMPLGAECM